MCYNLIGEFMNSKNIKTFIKASISSMSSALIDLGLFTLISRSSKALIIITIATIVARVASATFNFIINKFWAFESKGSTKKEAILFFILFISKMLLSALLVWLFKFININQTFLKALVDIFLFFFSYIIQKRLIFK